MPLNRLEIFEEKLSRILDPGETALFLGTAMYVAGEEQLGPDRPLSKATLKPVDIVLGLGTPFEREIMAFLNGRSLVGDRGCQAEALARVLDGIPDLLVTDRRLLAVTQQGDAFRTLWQAPRPEVIAAAPAPRLGQMGRVRLVLSDGSGLAVVLGLIFRSRARRFLAALQPVADELR